MWLDSTEKMFGKVKGGKGSGKARHTKLGKKTKKGALGVPDRDISYFMGGK
jgi:hypothetical protein